MRFGLFVVVFITQMYACCLASFSSHRGNTSVCSTPAVRRCCAMLHSTRSTRRIPGKPWEPAARPSRSRFTTQQNPWKWTRTWWKCCFNTHLRLLSAPSSQNGVCRTLSLSGPLACVCVCLLVSQIELQLFIAVGFTYVSRKYWTFTSTTYIEQHQLVSLLIQNINI